VATIEGKGRLTKDKTIKIRMDALEIQVLDGVSNSLGYAERATTIRWLIKHYPDIAASKLVIDRYRAAKDAEASLREATCGGL
jgi:hypothetical protein